MTLLRRGMFEILASVLLFSILATVLFASCFSAFGHPQKVKDWFRQSGIYDQIVTNAIDHAQKSVTAGSSDTTAVSLNDPLVEDVARDVFSSQYVQQNVETFIDSNYAWLQNKTKSPDFSINLTQNKQQFAQAVGDKTQAYLANLQVCTNQQLAQLQANGQINPLALACRPAQIDPKTEALKVGQEVATSPFIDNPVITADTISSGYGLTENEPYYRTFSMAPAAYTVGKVAPIIFAVIAVAAIIGLFVAAKNKRVALRRIAFISFVSGVVLVSIKLLMDFIFNRIEARTFTNQNATDLKQPITNIFHHAEQSLVSVDLYSGIALLAIAFIISIWLLKTRTPKVPHTTRIGEYEQPAAEEQRRPDTTPIVKRQRPVGPAMDIMSPNIQESQQPTTAPKPVQTTPSESAALKQNAPRARRRFID